MSKKPKNYINNPDFIIELKKFHETNVISQKLHKMIFLLAERIARQSVYYRYICEKTTKSINMNETYEEMIHEGYAKCLEKLEKFSMDKTNPFSYFTSIINNAFKDYFYKENRFEKIKFESQRDYENRFNLKYGFRPSKTNYDEQEGF